MLWKMKFASRPLLSEQNTLQKTVEEQKIFKFLKKWIFSSRKKNCWKMLKKRRQCLSVSAWKRNSGSAFFSIFQQFFFQLEEKHFFKEFEDLLFFHCFFFFLQSVHNFSAGYWKQISSSSIFHSILILTFLSIWTSVEIQISMRKMVEDPKKAPPMMKIQTLYYMRVH